MNFKSDKIDSFQQFSQFSTLKEFNHHFELWLLEHKHEFTKAEIVGLKRLVRFAAKIPGVCNAKIATILKAIHDDYHQNGISRSTFKRMITKAKTLGILTVYETDRKNGSQSSNLYIFNRFPTNEPPKLEILNHLNKTINPSETKNNIKERNNDRDPKLNQDLDYTFTSDRVPKAFRQLAKSYFRDAQTIEEYWRMTTISAYRNNREKETGTVLKIACDSFKQLLRKLKTTKAVKKPIGYYYGILSKKFQELYFEELYEMGFESTVRDNLAGIAPQLYMFRI